jgi:DNA-binding SARP family transcriptional activator
MPESGEILVDSKLEIRLFGEPRFAFGGKVWHFSAPPRTLPLLAYLIVHAGEQISRARLATLVWPDDLDDAARSNLRRHLHLIARALPPTQGASWLVASKGSVAWNDRSPAWVDVLEFKRLSEDPQTFAQAAAMYRGDLIETLHDEWILAERERFQSLALTMMYGLTVAARLRRDYVEAVAQAERILALDEWREDALRALMSARYESGDRSAALAAYERFALRLHAEMQVEPMPETAALRDLIVGDRPLTPPADMPLPVEAPERAGRSLHLPFVGRSEVLESLRTAWMRAAHESGSLVFVTGEPGIGKSRLAAELSSIAELQGGRTLVGLTSSPERAPYQPLVDAVRRGLPYLAKAAVDPIWLSVIATLVPEVLGLRSGLVVAETIEPQAARARLHEAFARIFECIARTRPLLIVVEDVHWAQVDTIEALTFLARRVGGMPVLVVALYRSDNLEPTHPLLEARRVLQSERRAATLALARLNAKDIAEFVARTRGISDAPLRLAEAIFRVSEGNPLFASQLLEEYVETGAFPDESSGVHELAEAIATRVERLDRQVRAVADVAATIGREFAAELVCGVGGWSEDVVLDALGALMDRHLVRETGASGFEYCFTHILIEHAIYDRTAAALRPKRHRRIAQLLSRMEARRNLYRAIAYHYERAGERAAAGRAYIEAARDALGVFARADAIGFARQALGFVAGDRDRYEALALSLSAQTQAGDSTHMNEDVVQIERIAERLGATERFAAMEFRQDCARMAGDREGQRAAIDAMLTIADGAGDPRMRARSLEESGTLLMALGRLLDAEEPLRTAFEIATRLPDQQLAARVRWRIVQTLVRRGDARAALDELEMQRTIVTDAPASSQERLYLLNAEAACAALFEDEPMCERVGREMLAVAQQLGDVGTEAKAHALLAHAAHQRFECAAMREHYAAARSLFENRCDWHALSVTLINQGALEREIGNFDEAVRLWSEGRDGRFAEVQTPDRLFVTSINLAEAEFARGNVERALPLVQSALGHAVASAEHRLNAEALVLLGSIECARGDADTGLVHLRAGVAERRGLNTPRTLADDLCAFIDVLLDSERLSEVASLAAELEALFDRAPDRQRYPTRICLVLSRCYAAVRDERAAARWMARGAEILATQLARFADAVDAERFADLSFNRAVVRWVQPTG